jgi:SAM-dependent methyltransferase
MQDFSNTKTLTDTHQNQQPSKWVTRWVHLIQPQSQVLDLACGCGRHSRFLSQHGHHVLAVDQDVLALASLANTPFITTQQADLENNPWPLQNDQFDAIVVTNYLWRPLWPKLLGSLKPGGLFIYETFAKGNETVGKPSRDDFLLQHGELLQRCAHMHVVAYQDGFLSAPDRFIQRIVAVKPSHETQSQSNNSSINPARYRLESATGGT